MEFSGLAKLGKVAGVLGVALGVVALLVRELMGRFELLPEAWRGPIFVAVLVGAVLLIGLAIVSSLFAGRPSAQVARTTGARSAAANKDRTTGGSGQTATTSGDDSPATNERG